MSRDNIHVEFALFIESDKVFAVTLNYKDYMIYASFELFLTCFNNHRVTVVSLLFLQKIYMLFLSIVSYRFVGRFQSVLLVQNAEKNE